MDRYFQKQINDLKNENRRLIAKIQEQNSNLNLLHDKLKILNKENKNYQRLYEFERNEKNRLLKNIYEKQEQIKF